MKKRTLAACTAVAVCLATMTAPAVAELAAAPSAAAPAALPTPSELGAAPDGGVLTDEQREKLAMAAFESSLKPQTGTIVLKDGIAELRMPEGYAYIGPEDADRLLQAWGNPPNPTTLGILYPTRFSLFAEESWAVIISFAEDGFVEDDDAEDIDYDELLTEMKNDTTASNEERSQQGYPPITLVGWAEPPHYDAASHKLYWAKELAFGTSPERTLNYAIRALGRRGVLELNAVATMRQLPEIKSGMAGVLTFVEFKEGHRYSDFDPDIDSVAAYGIGALIAGKVAAKAGLFKGLVALLLASKKLIVAGLAALAMGAKALFDRRRGGRDA